MRRPPRSTLFPYTRSSDLAAAVDAAVSRLRSFPPLVFAGECDELTDKLAAVSRDTDRKSTRLNSSHVEISYAVFCLKKKKKKTQSSIHYYTHFHIYSFLLY